MHFHLLGTDADPAKEDLVRTLLGVIGYSLQSFRMRPEDTPKTHRHMRSEWHRVTVKALA